MPRFIFRILLHPSQALHDNAHATSCQISGAPTIRSKAGYGDIKIFGFGRLNGRKMMESFRCGSLSCSGENAWSSPGAGAFNGYGSAVAKFRTIADAESHTRWRIMSGMLEISPLALANVFCSVLLWHGMECQRGDSAIRLQFPRVPGYRLLPRIAIKL